MVEVMFEILLFSAYLSAALISVVIAVYAIAVSYLGRETSRSIWSLKRRQMELENRIKKSEEKMDVTEMEKEIKRYRQEETALKEKLRFLSLNGAILLPLAALLVALFFSLIGMYTYSWNPETISSYIFVSLVANAIGIVFLLKVLKTVEWAALKVPLPKFEVLFESGLNKEKVVVKAKRMLRIIISNNGDVMAENLEVFVFFPQGFKVNERRPYRVVPQTEVSDHPGYNAVIFDYDRIHLNVKMLSPKIDIEAPEKSDKYEIPICIYERNVGESEHELFLEVVD